MSWLPEFGQVIHEAARLRSMTDPVEGARDLVLAGEPERLLAAFPDGVRIADPGAGTVEGIAALEAYGAQSRDWLVRRDARVRPIATTIGLQRVVGEFEVELTEVDRTFALPVAIVAEVDPAGRSAWLRVYHSQWPLLGRHVLRPPLLAKDPQVHESDVVGEYQAALTAGDTERIVGTFEPDGCFREPAGSQYRVCGTEGLRDFFGRFFSAGGGILLEHCTVTEDGTRTALEFNAVRWGDVDLPPQAGVAVYERGATGRLHEARIYDDVEGPVEE